MIHSVIFVLLCLSISRFQSKTHFMTPEGMFHVYTRKQTCLFCSALLSLPLSVTQTLWIVNRVLGWNSARLQPFIMYHIIDKPKLIDCGRICSYVPVMSPVCVHQCFCLDVCVKWWWNKHFPAEFVSRYITVYSDLACCLYAYCTKWPIIGLILERVCFSHISHSYYFQVCYLKGVAYCLCILLIKFVKE